MLRLAGLSKHYDDIVALDGCSFDVPRGTLLGFLGPNGAGKTTAMRTVFGLVTPDAGSVSWDGGAITNRTRLGFGYMPEQRGLYPRMRIGKQLSYFGQLHGMSATDAGTAASRWLDLLGLGERSRDRLEDLSHGNQQRVQLAAALVHDPELLVLDEPFSGLDPIGVQAMANILAERAAAGTAVVFSSHQLDLVEDLCESVVVINRGSIVLSGLVRELRASSPHRYVDIEVGGVAAAWYDTLPESEVVNREDGRARLRVSVDADPAELLRTAEAAGAVREFSFAPPSLSQVFREAVGQ
ncbi:MAG TPA: ATP-binding cassette domain-containing protein [Acidimicrobiia bacterium]|jgi:ABC-2 type transport system ATP-binding protein|nr:ATP-binding cassette domain-containing protein [Acidimicrobiia bacterium]